MDRQSFDNQIFTWQQWAPEGPFSMQFEGVELKVPVGQFSAGTKFPFAFLLGDISLLVLVDDQNKEYGFDLKLNVGEAVEPPVAQEGDACDCGHDHGDHHH